MSEPFSVSGKTAIVTGAGSGINLAFATLLLQHNCNVVFADLTLRPEAQQVVDTHSAPTARPRALFVRTDVRSWPALDSLFATAVTEFGSFDIVCPGAGVYEPDWSSFWHPPGSAGSVDDPRGGRYALLDINLIHPFRATQLALSYWLHPGPASESGSGSGSGAATATTATTATPPPSTKRILHISSIAAQVPNLNAPLYAASKHAISGLVRSLAGLERAVGVRVNAVAPGLIRTPLWTEHPEKLRYVDPTTDAWASADEVAAAMLRCLTDPDLVAGSVLEVGRANTRLVRTYNDPGPDHDPSKGLVAGKVAEGASVVKALLDDPGVWGVR